MTDCYKQLLANNILLEGVVYVMNQYTNSDRRRVSANWQALFWSKCSSCRDCFTREVSTDCLTYRAGPEDELIGPYQWYKDNNENMPSLVVFGNCGIASVLIEMRIISTAFSCSKASHCLSSGDLN